MGYPSLMYNLIKFTNMAEAKKERLPIAVSLLLIGDTFSVGERRITKCLAQTKDGDIPVYCQGAKSSTPGKLVPITYTNKMGQEVEAYEFYAVVPTRGVSMEGLD